MHTPVNAGAGWLVIDQAKKIKMRRLQNNCVGGVGGVGGLKGSKDPSLPIMPGRGSPMPMQFYQEAHLLHTPPPQGGAPPPARGSQSELGGDVLNFTEGEKRFEVRKEKHTPLNKRF